MPSQAIVRGDRVFVFDDETGLLHETAITAGVSNWEFTEVMDGLKEGQYLVLSIDREGVEDGAAVVADKP